MAFQMPYWWDQVKHHAWLWFNRAAQFWLLQTLLFYVWSCVVAGAPVSPTDYVRFTYYAVQWRPGQPVAAALSSKSEGHKGEEIGEADTPHMNFLHMPPRATDRAKGR